jgi:hypothetical protein
LRPSDHSASDLFGSFTPPPIQKLTSSALSPEKPPKPLKPSSNSSSTPKLLPKPSQMTVKTFKLSGLSSKTDFLSIKNLCKGFHVFKINPNIDNVTGTCNGLAEVQVRTSENNEDCKSFMLQMIRQGLGVEEIREKHGIKNNRLWNKRDFLDPGMQNEEKNFKGKGLKCDERKKVNLETSPDFVGSLIFNRVDTSGSETKEIMKEDRKAFETLRKWESFKYLEKRTAVTPVKGLAGYLKSTISSKNKGKGVK